VPRFISLMTCAALVALVFSPDAMAEAKPKTAPQAATKAVGNHAYPLLPAGAGRPVMVRVCSACHTPERAATQRHDLDGWNKVIDQMATNGAVATDDEFDQIAAYLTRSFPPGKPLPKNLPASLMP
jgi:cytochrome c5